MIVRKYLERKGEGDTESSKEMHKKDLRGEFRSEVVTGMSTNVGLMKKASCEDKLLNYRYDER
jgi:hypothetical protein